MEDCNTLAADCVVISCCCQCLIIQVLIFILLKLPCKLVRKTKEYAKKKLRKRKKKLANARPSSSKGRFRYESSDCCERSSSIQMQGEHGCGSCMEKVERVLEEFSQRGEFAFGSFWGRDTSGRSSSMCVATQELDFNLVRIEIVELTMVSPSRYEKND